MSIEEIQESIRKLEVAAGERGPRTWRGPRLPETDARKRARKRAKATRKRNR
jgi:hypothetical protein